MPATRTVVAAGGIVCRHREGRLEIALIHRPRYDDWSLPKGKLEDGETELACAVREVGEEIGALVAVSRRVATVRYEIGEIRKRVTYWVMHERGGHFEPNDEVDAIEWLTPRSARSRLSYDADQMVLAHFAAMPLPDSVVVLLRHAKAGKRSQWRGDDALRPLDPNGIVQAAKLAASMAFFAPEQIFAADRTRCIQTVEPLAAALDLPVQVDPVFADESYARSPGASQTALLALAKPGMVSLICSQGLTIPSLVDTLGPGVRSADTRKGAAWVLSFVDGDVIAADHYDAP